MHKIEDIINKIHCCENLEFMRDMPTECVDTEIADPPYGLKFMGKKWDYDVPSVEVFVEMLRVLKPGGTLLCFAGSRTQHRMACNVEDAGFILKDCIMWLYGSGFPKATDISKQLDKQGKKDEFFDEVRCMLKNSLKASGFSVKAVNEFMGYATNGSGMAGHWFANISQQTLPTKEQWFKLKGLLNFPDDLDGIFKACVTPNERPITGKQKGKIEGFYNPGIANYKTGDIDITAPYALDAQLWNGWKSHGLKPAYEPILVAMKPNDGTYANNALKHGVSGLNIDGGRIDTQENLNGGAYSKGEYDTTGKTYELGLKRQEGQYKQPQGRFPANIILDEEAGRMLDEQSGQLKSGAMTKPYKYTNNGYSLGQPTGETKQIHNSNSGGASRFFYCAKASKAERNAGCEELDTKQIAYQDYRENVATTKSYVSEYPDGTPRPMNKGKNNHPTVKPLALMEYLCTLTKTPTGGIVLDPFCGSGTTCKAAKNVGRDYIGVEREPEYCKIAEKRIQEEKDKYGLFPG